MARRPQPKPTETDVFDELEDGDKVIITDQRIIEKKTASNRPAGDPQNEASKVIEIEPEEDDDETGPFASYSDNSILAFIASDNLEDELDGSQCSISIRREPDTHGDQFKKSCKSRMQLPTMRHVSVSTDRLDIEDEIRNIHGGGHYLLQIYFNGRLTKSWKVSLSDPPEIDSRAAAAAPAIGSQQPPQPAAAPANPLAPLFEALRVQKELKDLLFGDELKELERLRAEAAKPQPAPAAPPENEKLALLRFAVDSKSEKLVEKAITTLFGEENSSGEFMEVARFLIDNKNEVITIGQGLLSAFLPTSQPPTVAKLEQMLGKKPQPTPNPPAAELPRSTFKPKAKKENKPE